ncbi:MAG: hypothetical protein Q9190_001088 [Brigantiaea leucoxantha]
MFREPEVVESKSAAKADLSAPARSSIRRQRFVRYHRDRSSSSQPRPYHSDNRRALLEAIRRRHSPPVSNRSSADRVVEVEAEANRAHAEASQRRRFDNGRAMLRDALSYERSGDMTSMPRETAYPTGSVRPPTPPSPYSRSPPAHVRRRSMLRHTDTIRTGPHGRWAGARSPAPEYIPSPPYTSGDSSDRSSSSREATTSRTTTSLTPRFAPAHPPARSHEIEDRDQSFLPSPGEERPSDAALEDLALLRRVQRQNAQETYRAPPNFPTQDATDGLGDRQRSVSPEDGSWETLLSTVTPDEQLPSLHSSFTSAAASASSFPSNEELVYYGNLAYLNSSSGATNDALTNVCENTDSEDSDDLDDDDDDDDDNNNNEIDASSTSDYARWRASLRDIDGGSTDSLELTSTLQDHHAMLMSSRRELQEREDELRRMQADLSRLRRHFPEGLSASTRIDMERGASSSGSTERGRL